VGFHFEAAVALAKPIELVIWLAKVLRNFVMVQYVS
jgi:hypothetical protein